MVGRHPLKQLRKDRRLTLDALGKELGVTGQTIWRWENGKREPRKPQLVRIKEKFGIDPAAILGFESEAA